MQPGDTNKKTVADGSKSESYLGHRTLLLVPNTANQTGAAVQAQDHSICSFRVPREDQTIFRPETTTWLGLQVRVAPLLKWMLAAWLVDCLTKCFPEPNWIVLNLI